MLLLLLLLLWCHHAWLWLAILRHVRYLALMTDIREICIVLLGLLLRHAILHSLLHETCGSLLRNVRLVTSIVATAIRSLALRVIGQSWLIASSLGLDRHVWEIDSGLGRWCCRWKVIVCLDV